MAIPFAPVPAAAHDVDRLVYQSDVAAVGVFRCAATHPLFHDSGPIRDHCVVFPRTAVTIRRRDHAAFQADPTVAPVYPPGLEYRRQRVDPVGDRCDYFVLGRDVAGSVERLFAAPFVRLSASTYLHQRALVDTLLTGTALDPLQIEEAIINVVSAVTASADDMARRRDGIAGASHRRLVDRAQSLLAQNLGNGMSLSALAARVGCSAFHLCRVFRAMTGRSLHEYRTELRLRTSLEHLDQGHDVTHVALDLGFSSHSHFTAAFRKRFGLTPRHWRRTRTTIAAQRRAAVRSRPATAFA